MFALSHQLIGKKECHGGVNVLLMNTLTTLAEFFICTFITGHQTFGTKV